MKSAQQKSGGMQPTDIAIKETAKQIVNSTPD
jgi:hypothetical protein